MSSLPFKVVFCTSADTGFAVTNLSDPKNTNGWASQRFSSTWPQILVFQLGSGTPNTTCLLSRIRILSHQFKIPTRVDIHIASGLEDWKTCSFHRLGHVLFSANIESNFRVWARELKSIYLNRATGTFLKLVFQKCHVNAFNVYSQISITGLFISGEEVPFSNDIAGNPNPVALNLPNNCSPLDPDTATIIDHLIIEKEKAVNEENYQFANTLKTVIDQLKITGAEIAIKEEGKRDAVRNEDYALAAKIKEEIQKLRAEAYSQVPSLGEREEEHFKFDPRQIFSAPTSRESTETATVAALEAEMASGNVIPVQQNQQIIPQLQTPKRQQGEVGSKKLHNAEEQIPASFERRIRQQQQQQLQFEQPPLPEINEEEETEQQNHIAPPSPLTSVQQTESHEAISVFGQLVIQSLFSKNRIHREHAVKEISSRLVDDSWQSENRDNPPDIFAASVQVAMQALGDTLPNIYLSGIILLDSLDTYYKKHNLKGKVAPDSLNTILSVLVNKLGDGNQRVRDSTCQIMFNLAKGIVGIQNILAVLVRQPRAGASWKQWNGRLNLLADLVQVFRIQLDPNFGSFISNALNNSSQEVRAAAIQVLFEMYKLSPDTTLKSVTDLNPPHLDLVIAAFSSHDGGHVKTSSRGSQKAEISPRRIGSSVNKHQTERPISAHPLVPALVGLPLTPGRQQQVSKESSPRKESPRKVQSARGSETQKKPKPQAANVDSSDFSLISSAPQNQLSARLPSKEERREKKSEERPLSARTSTRKTDIPPPPQPQQQQLLLQQMKNQQQQQQQQHSPRQTSQQNSRKPSAISSAFGQLLMALPEESIEEESKTDPSELPSEHPSARSHQIPSQQSPLLDADEEDEEEEFPNDFDETGSVEAEISAATTPPETSEPIHDLSSIREQQSHSQANSETQPTQTLTFLCSFCQSSFLDEKTLGNHYLIDCPLLCECPYCGQVIEISCANEHLLNECESGISCKQCHCLRVLKAGDDFDTHSAKCNDHPALHCLLCDHVIFEFLDSMSEEEKQQLWFQHLTVECKRNSRSHK